MTSSREIEFEWDLAKARINLKKHMVWFLTALTIFLNERLERIDNREDYGEMRWIALGRVDGEVYRVIYTWRNENLVRILSAQKASMDEREIYYRETLISRNHRHTRARRGRNEPGCAGGRVAGCGILEIRSSGHAVGKDLGSPAPRQPRGRVVPVARQRTLDAYECRSKGIR